MSILACFRAFQQGLLNVLGTAGALKVRLELGEEHLDLLEEYIGQEQAKPSVIWVPIGARSIEQIGGLRGPTTVKALVPVAGTPPVVADPIGIRSPLRIAARDEEIDAWVWTRTFDECETLLNHVVAAMRFQATGHGFKPMATRWSVGVDRKPKRGALCALRFSVKVPFTAEPDSIATPTSFSLDGEIVQEITQ